MIYINNFKQQHIKNMFIIYIRLLVFSLLCKASVWYKAEYYSIMLFVGGLEGIEGQVQGVEPSST